MVRNTFNRFITEQHSTERVTISQRWSAQGLGFLVIWILLQSMLTPLTAHAHASQTAVGRSQYQAARRLIEEATNPHPSTKSTTIPVTVPTWPNAIIGITIFFGVLSNILFCNISVSYRPSHLSSKPCPKHCLKHTLAPLLR